MGLLKKIDLFYKMAQQLEQTSPLNDDSREPEAVESIKDLPKKNARSSILAALIKR
jgi:hypothetical protein